jgi:hypothetical protein
MDGPRGQGGPGLAGQLGRSAVRWSYGSYPSLSRPEAPVNPSAASPGGLSVVGECQDPGQRARLQQQRIHGLDTAFAETEQHNIGRVFADPHRLV